MWLDFKIKKAIAMKCYSDCVISDELNMIMSYNRFQSFKEEFKSDICHQRSQASGGV